MQFSVGRFVYHLHLSPDRLRLSHSQRLNSGKPLAPAAVSGCGQSQRGQTGRSR